MVSEKDKRWSLGTSLSISVLIVLLALPCVADANSSAVESNSDADTAGTAGAYVESDNESTADGSVQDSTTDRGATGHLSKLQIHGFLTQAWADATFADVEVGELPPPPFGPGGIGPLGPSPDGTEISLGVPEGGTTDYRFLALQFRYAVSPKDTFVVQFASRALGVSPLQDFEDEIELDWAFYERRLTTRTRLKVGRVLIPFGIYNELRDVGTVLPFYRPAFVRYKEGAFTSETLDGLSLSHTFFSQSDWGLNLTVFGGEWKSIALFPPQPELSQVLRQKDGYGYQLWLNTPLSGLRIGTGLLSFEAAESNFPLRSLDRRNILHASLDATFGRFTLQAEWDEDNIDVAFGTLPVTTTTSDWYVLAGVKVTEKLRIWGQMESAEFQQESVAFVDSVGYTSREDLGISLNYIFSPNLLLKAEYHTVEGEFFNLFPDFSTGALLLRPDVFYIKDGSYTIVSLSVSF